MYVYFCNYKSFKYIRITKIFSNHIPWLHFDLGQQYLTSISLKYGFDDIDLLDWKT